MIALLFVSALMCLQNPTGLRNLDFELGKPGTAPPGWVVDKGYRIQIEDHGAKEGKYCASIERMPSEAPSSYGTINQAVDVVPFRGKRLVIHSFVRSQPSIPSNDASLFLAVYRADGSVASYNNNDSYSIRTEQWTSFDISTDIGPDAQKIEFGLMIQGDGKAFWDDIRVDVVQVSGRANEPPKPLEGRALENVVAFARLLGYLRYFYPGNEASKVKWDQFTIDGIRTVESAKDAAELAKLLDEWCRPAAFSIRVFPSKDEGSVRSKFALPKDGAVGKVFWRYQGAPGGTSNSEYFRAERIRVFFDRKDSFVENSPDPEQPYFADLGGGVSCLIPLALYENAFGPLTGAFNEPQKKAPPRSADFAPSGNDRATRLAAIALTWNVFQHFYPYFDVIHADWMPTLPKLLQAAAMDTDEKAFLRTLRQMLVPLQDGHASVTLIKESAQYCPPIAWDWVENNLVITKVTQESQGELRVGDIVSMVDGVETRKALEAIESYISSPTPQWKRWNGIRQLLQGPVNSMLTVQLKGRDGNLRKAKLSRTIWVGSGEWQNLQESRPEKIAKLKPGIFYLDIDRITNDDFQKALAQLVDAKGIVFDFRGYPWKIDDVFLQHLVKKRPLVPGAYMPIVYFPDRQRLSFTRDLDEGLDPRPPFLNAKLAFLIGGGTISMAESYLTVVEANHLGEVIGSTTAGTNGVVNTFVLPGDYQIQWTAMKMTKPNEVLFHGIGVAPTIHVEKTIRGVVEGHDELLEAGIAAVSR